MYAPRRPTCAYGCAALALDDWLVPSIHRQRSDCNKAMRLEYLWVAAVLHEFLGIHYIPCRAVEVEEREGGAAEEGARKREEKSETKPDKPGRNERPG